MTLIKVGKKRLKFGGAPRPSLVIPTPSQERVPVSPEGYLIVARRRQPKGMQFTAEEVAFRPATCAEVSCHFFLYGASGVDAGQPYTHPVGVECGDFRGCLPCADPPAVYNARLRRNVKGQCGKCVPCRAGTANCPCADRRLDHKLPSEQHPPRFLFGVERTVKQVTESEWHDRTGDGFYARQHIMTRGL